MTVGPTGNSIGYVEVLRSNPSFTWLWTGQVVSQLGDWFNSVALFTLLLELTGSGEAVGYVLILKLLPAFFVGPLAGVIADRFSRKSIMISADILRGILVVGFVFIDGPDQVWLVYVLATLQVVASAFFEPAKSAAIPSVVSREGLLAANAISGASWSITLAVGAALGGVVTDAFGRDTAFIIDSTSYLVSALLISRVRLAPGSPALADRDIAGIQPDRGTRSFLVNVTGVRDFLDGARYLKSNLRVMAVLMVKSGWGLGGGVLLLLTVFGKQVFPLGRDGSTSIGLLYAARGLGALLGPMIARWMTDGSPRTLRKAIGAAFFVSAAFYLLFGAAPSLWWAMLFVVGAHAGGSIQWVFSTTLLQLSVPNRFLGRVFALELALVTLTMSASTYLSGRALEHWGLTPREVVLALGLAFVIPGTCWLVVQRWMNGKSTAFKPKAALEPEPVSETSFPPT